MIRSERGHWNPKDGWKSEVFLFMNWFWIDDVFFNEAMYFSSKIIFNSSAIDQYQDSSEQHLFLLIEGQKKTVPGGAITKRVQSYGGSCERANTLKSSTTLTTSLATSPALAGPAKRSKMILEKQKWQILPPQVATTRRVLEYRLVPLRRKNQVISKFCPQL